MIHTYVAATTHVGLVRSNHEDSIHVNGWTASSSGAKIQMSLSGSGVVAVIDGMGGHTGGEMASRTASAAIADMRLASARSPREVDDILQCVADAVRETGAIIEGHASMGATIAGLVLQSESVILFNVGDCSILRIKDGYVGQLALIDRSVREDGRSGKVTQALGGTPHPVKIDAHAEEFTPAADDVLVLCSDGLTDTVDNDTIVALATSFPEPAELADQLVSAAYKAGAPDNMSVIVIAFSIDEQYQLVHREAI